MPTKTKNPVILKGRKEGIAIVMDADMPFEQLTEHFRQTVLDAKQFFEGGKANITFTGRTLSDTEETALLEIIMTETTLKVPILAPDGFKTPTIARAVTPTRLASNERVTAYYTGGLRSGQVIRSNASVVVVGDANPGSEIIAEGHVIVLGSLKGVVHAGCSGDESAFVSASLFQPTQLRIAGNITVIPEENRNKIPARAYLKNGKVRVEQLL